MRESNNVQAILDVSLYAPRYATLITLKYTYIRNYNE